LLAYKTIMLLVPFVPSMSRGITLGEDIARADLFEGHHLNKAISRYIDSSGLACSPSHSACSADGALPQTPPNFRLM
jgi:hypothetical protein